MHAVSARTTIGVDLPPDLLPPELSTPALSLDIDLVTVAPKLQFDTRDNPFYPRDAWLIEGTLGISRQGLGGDVDCERHNWAVNHYLALSDLATLALRGAVQYVSGDAPFFVYPAFGQGSDLRGYQACTDRDRFLFAAQAEWRQRLSPRWGAVVFAGVGIVALGFGDWGETLPSTGFGIRWVAAPRNNLSVQVDFA